MARFHVTSDLDSHREARTTCKQGQLEPDGTVDDDGIYLTTYGKRAIDTRNFYDVGGGDFVAVTGTLILNGQMGEQALPEIHRIYTELGINELRNQCFGQYAVLIKDGDEIFVFCDPNGVYQTYYVNGSSWFISNSLFLCGQSLDERVIDRYALYRRIIESTELSTSTLFKDVSRLSGREKLVVDVPTDSIAIERLEYPPNDWSYPDASLDHILEDYTARTEDVFSQISNAADGIGIQVTGGLDSRTVLAGVLNAGDDPLILYGVGNSKITNTKEGDLKIARQYADRYDLPFYQMDWTGDYPIPVDVWDELFTKYGFRYRMYGATPSFFSEFETGFPGEPELILNGYGFGIFSNVYYWEDDSLVPISFDDIVTDVFTSAKGFTREAFPCKDEYLNRLVDTCKDVLDEFEKSIDLDEPMNLDEFTRTIQVLNGRPQSPYCNVVNEFTYHLSPFATYGLGQPMIDVPAKYRVGETMRIKLLRRLYADLLDVPVFSGTRKQKFTDTDEMKLITTERLIDICGSLLPDIALRFLRPIYKAQTDSSYGDVNDKIFEAHRERISEDGPISDCFNLKEYEDHIRRHSRFALFEHGIYEIGYEGVHE